MKQFPEAVVDQCAFSFVFVSCTFLLNGIPSRYSLPIAMKISISDTNLTQNESFIVYKNVAKLPVLRSQFEEPASDRMVLFLIFVS